MITITNCMNGVKFVMDSEAIDQLKKNYEFAKEHDHARVEFRGMQLHFCEAEDIIKVSSE